MRGRRRHSIPWLPGGLFLLLSVSPHGARSQIISPGELTAAHASLEGIRNCTNCHEIRQRGISPAKCLDCHTPLRTRISRGEGLHANLSRQCGSCHKDHFGRQFDPIRLSTGSFDHTQTGFRLVGRHRNLTCRNCHSASAVTDPAVRQFKGRAGRLGQTFLGLPDQCAQCHDDDDPHGSTFRGQNCATCHSPAGWSDVSDFDHAVTGFSLIGQHARASCASCHGDADRGPARFANTPSACASCHGGESPHSQRLNSRDCGSCHNANGWSGVRNFDHAATGFALVGQHARATCAQCHGSASQGAARFRGVDDSCASCHGEENPHGAQFSGQSCGSCHTPQTWNSAPNFNHDRTEFPLTGSHERLDCASCHPGSGPTQQFSGTEFATCATCHDDAHDGDFGTDCATCHTTTSWQRMGQTFDASRFNHEEHTGYALVGAHIRLACATCHVQPARVDEAIRITLVGGRSDASFPAVQAEDCQSCHQDFHDGDLATVEGGAVCDNCHNQDGWTPTSFDLTRHAETQFPLSGAHLATPCTACHATDGLEAPDFKLEAACESCHVELSPHGDEFADTDGATRCAGCHNTVDWDLASFDHSQTGFALAGAHFALDCGSCHTTEIRPDGREVRRFQGLETGCMSCHAESDPHRGQFEGESCDSCHDTEAFTVSAFDHNRARFSLEGAHISVACGACHRPEIDESGRSFIRFKPLGTACEDCHGE